jgi:hypothetical protein
VAKVHPHITDAIRAFIDKQHLFFVATAPLADSGHVNLSPKGHDAFRILGPDRVAYLDLTGSGNETSAHLHENGRITFMFCAFDGPPDIVRLYGKGRVILPGAPEWDELYALFPQDFLGVRQIIVADISRVQTSCGYAVPLMTYEGERTQLRRWAEANGPDGVVAYWQQKNLCSIDGLPTPLAVNGEAVE